jgi:hypothetical protein
MTDNLDTNLPDDEDGIEIEDEIREFDPLNPETPTRDPRGKARIEHAIPKRRRGGRPRKGEEAIKGGYQTVWAPQKRADGSPGPQYALLACPFSEIFFGGARGGGKSLTLDELIVTPTGYRRMGEMSIGDEVHGPDGTVARVIGVYPQGVEDVFRITLVDGRTVRASRGHLWRIRVGPDEMTVTTDCVRKFLLARMEVSLPVETLECWVAIAAIEYAGLAETQCIKIDSDDGLFLTNDEIVTHNTDGAIGVWLEHAARYGANAKGLFLRRQYANLKDVLERMNTLFPKVGATFNKGEGIWLFPNGANLKLGHLWDETATNAYQGHAYSILFFEELTQWPTPMPIDMMRATLRSAQGVPTKLIMTGNPGGAGHGWVRERYVSPAPAGFTPITDPKTGKTRIYIPSRVTDNLLLMQNDPNYIANLKQSGSDILVKAWLEGDWNIVAGGFFSDILNPEKHFIRPFEIPDTWRYRRSFDWGSAAPAALCIWAVSDGNPVPDLDGFVFPRGSLILVKEWYTVAMKDDGTLQPNQGQRLTNLALGNGVGQRSLKYNFSGCVADPSIFAKPGRESIFDEMKKGAAEVGHNLILSPADNNRVAGWQRMRDMLENATKDIPEKPGLWIFNTCKHWIRTVPVLQRDETKPDDLDTSQEDHCLAGNTWVETDRGHVAIRDLVGTTGKVRQDDGSWRRYSDCRRTRIAANTIRVVTSDGRSVVCTPDHLILTDDGWVEAKDTVGMTLACVDAACEVTRIEPAKDQDVYNLEVEDTHAFAVNGGLIVHNCADATRYAVQTGVRSMVIGDLSGR